MRSELTIEQIIAIILRRIWLIIFSILLMALLFFVVSEFIITPKYTASASMYVYSEKNRVDTITQTDLTTSQKLVSTYIVILESNSVLDKVSTQLNGKYTAEQIRSMMSATAINNTEAFNIKITAIDPNEAMTIANTVANVAPAEIIRVVKAGSVEVIDYATVPKAPSSPNIIKNTLIGALIGFFLSAGCVMVVALFDTLIRSEDDVMEITDLPILGVIPTINSQKNSSSYVNKY